ncbi:molybdenum ABC transporter ATP-binding protein [Rhodanobacter sp. C05]|uniref:molybdenum ABC transporter ATP-binding protein n=1 Tax=Rhodanobacter sp. C05 TaxID=1945855 RepID=UPI000986AC20|nr:molybdenum ABC transporter ATP-binding protein [Rhodanobacter sp. C05]OOG41479.1 molybdenum ABC transporter ATP-binding protein [Rhodanobacter sp. C05]
MIEVSSGLQVQLQYQRGDFALDVDIYVPSRGITALFGPSGAGKTTCLRAIAGLDPDIEGRITFAGDIWQDSSTRRIVPTHRRRIGYVFQEASLFPHLSVSGNLGYGQRRAAGNKPVDREALLKQFGVDHLLARKVDRLSGGERQRVAIVRALLSDPVLLLLDEPLSALDAPARSELLGCLEQLHAELGIPTIYVSHAIDEVARLADHLVVMEAGRVLSQGSLQATLASGELPLAMSDQLGVVIEGQVIAQDPVDHLIELAFEGGRLWLPQRAERVGDRLRCRIGARDVVLGTSPPAAGSSALNVVQAVVVGIIDAAHPSQCIVRLDVHGTALLASITRRSWRSLALAPGSRVWAQVKATALGS